MIIKRKNKLSFIIFLIIIPILILLYKRIYYFNSIKTNIKKINIYLEETSHIQEITNNNNHNKLSEEKTHYIAIIEIPKISLKEGLLSPEDKYNDVKYNIAILPSSNMPNIVNSNLILAAHNGNSAVSYFKDLSKLDKGDLINIYYHGTKYIYKLNNYYEIEKTFEASIIRDATTNALTLITCKDNSDTFQMVYIAYLISKETY